MRYILIFPAFLFYLFSYSQDTVNQVDVSGKKHGFWIKKDSLGTKIHEGRFDHGIPVGVFRYFYKDGKLKTTSRLSEGGKFAFTVSYFPNGKKMAEGCYRNEKKDSIWVFYSEFSDVKTKEETYKEGILNGPSKLFFPEGGCAEQKNYVNGILEGAWEKYDEKGNLRLKGNFMAGEKQGNLFIYGPKQQVMTRGKYNQGHQDGEWTYYTEEGKIRKKETYKMGRLMKTVETDPKESTIQK